MKISVFGTGYVGLVQGVCLADLGHNITCVDVLEDKIEKLKKGDLPFFEPGLEELINKNKSRLNFTTDSSSAIDSAEIIFIAVGTPQQEDGSADLKFIDEVAKTIGQHLTGYKLIVVKSTVPPGTNEEIEKVIKKQYDGDFDIASNPEFLRQGSAVKDFMFPDRVVIGTKSQKAADILSKLYSPLKSPIVVTDTKSSELIKYAANSFLANKISFINSIANLSEKIGGNIDDISYAMGLDKRIGNLFLKAGIGYGGSCFPKDVKALIHISHQNGYEFEILKAVDKVNHDQRISPVVKLQKKLPNLKGANIALLGLTFKPDTDDIREAPSLNIIKELLEKDVNVHAWDPLAETVVSRIYPNVFYHPDPYEALTDKDAVIIVTEWDEVKNLDLNKVKKLMKNPLIIDGRNIIKKEEALKIGIDYVGVGR